MQIRRTVDFDVESGTEHERSFCNRDCLGVGSCLVAARRTVRALDGRHAMTGTELIALLLSIGLMAYLIVALLKPEWFS